MGTVLYLKKANFSENAVGQTSPLGTVLTKYTTPGYFGCMFSFNHDPLINWGLSKRSATFANKRVAVFDVTNYQGKEIILYGTRQSLTDYTPGNVTRSYIAFTENLGGLSLSDLASLDESVNAIYPIMLIDPSPVSAVEALDNYFWDLRVPNNAKYILIPEEISINNAKVIGLD